MKKILLSFICITLLFVSCANDDDRTSEKQIDVYVAGIIKGATEDYHIPAVAKNGVVTPIGAESPDIDIYAMAVHNNDVYVVGRNGASAVYWKNGTEVKLTDGTGYAVASDVKVYNNIVYIVGHEVVNGIIVAKYWKNGTAINLSDGVTSSIARAIVIENNDVYVAGYDVTRPASTAPYNLYVPKYWKNGVSVILPGSSSVPCVWDIDVNKGNVYVAGSNNAQAGIWENGVFTTINEENPPSYAGDVIVYNDIVYVAGDIQTEKYTPYYWKNGTPIALPDDNRGARTHDITVFKDRVYIVGRFENSGGALWIDGVLQNLDMESANAVFVVENS